MSDDYIEIQINGVDMLMPAGSTVEDALALMQDKLDVGTLTVDPESVQYVRFLDTALSEQGYRLEVDAGQIPPFLVVRLDRDDDDEEHAFDTTNEIHQFIRQAEARANETHRPDSRFPTGYSRTGS